ncbi:amphi-Trp domain-containing protein [Tumebacillus permanentifrigoris]|uniref:Amphi-Trp domain-containing protein n=1 Tax=Tumebacillus permanentifrigoris TaxID=378543 RepID=A0A316D6U7_9BACL|nr:amphi-Trp domain-containing protein [Tumebacillus permanentifrigoris]PWK10314.1 hypothetical protein C7459_112136 [Tumebacillus permanentifrigoris]
MRKSEIKIKRRDVMSASEVADLLRQWANQIDSENIVSLDGLPISVANVLYVRQDYRKEGNEHALTLKLSWVDNSSDQSMAGEPEDLEEEDLDILPGESDHPTPLDLPSCPDEHRAKE